jgi:short-subunit dehydrogenase
MQAVLPHFIEAKSGKFIFISSVQGLLPLPLRSSYAMSKHALHGFGHALSMEGRVHGVHTTIVCPGYINTNLSLNALNPDGSRYNKIDANTASGLDPAVVAHAAYSAALSHSTQVVIADLKTRVVVALWPIVPDIIAQVLLARAAKQALMERA